MLFFFALTLAGRQAAPPNPMIQENNRQETKKTKTGSSPKY
jgi:hypothetical protein